MCFSTKACLTPMQFRRKALELGFETKQKVRPPLPSLPVSMSQAASSSATGQVEGARAKPKPRPQARSNVKAIAAAWPASAAVVKQRRTSWASGSEGDFTGTISTDDSYDLVSSTGGFAHEDTEAESARGVAPEVETTFSDEEDDGATDKDYEFVNATVESDRNPESPMASPRFTQADYSRLAVVMQDLGNLNRKLLAFTSEALPHDGAAGEPAYPEEEGEYEEDREGQEADDDKVATSSFAAHLAPQLGS